MADVGIKIKATDEASGVFSKVASEAGKLQTSVATVGSSFAAMGSAAVAGLSVLSFAQQIKQTIDLADSFNKLSQKTGIAVEEFSKLNYAAGLADVTTEELSAGMRKLNMSIAQAAGGNEDKAKLFTALGVSFKDAAGQALSADKVFSQLAQTMSESADGPEKVAVGSELMGKGFEKLIPLTNAGAKGLADMGDEAQKLGIVMSADFAKNAEEFNDNLHKISVAGQGLFVTLGSDLVKGLGNVAGEMARAAIEGGKLAAVIAGIQTLFTGTDQYKNDKALTDQTEQLLSLEKALNQQKAEGYAIDSRVVKNTLAQIQSIKEELAVTQNYRKVLQGLDDDKKKAEQAKPTTVSPTIKTANALLGAGGNAPKAPKEKGNAFAGEQEAAKEWAKALESAGKATDDLRAKNLGLSKSEEDLKRYMESAAAAINEKTNPAMNDMVQAALQANIALEAMGKLADTIESQQKRTATAEDETQKERDRVAAIGLTEQAVANLNATRLEEMATAKERSLVAADEIDLSGELSESIKREVKALRERAGLVRQGGIKEAEVAAAKAATDEWKRGWEETDRIARDAFTGWAENGTSMAEAIGKSLKKALLSAIYEATLKPIAFQLYTSIAGNGGAAGAFGVSPNDSPVSGTSMVSGASALTAWTSDFQTAGTKMLGNIGMKMMDSSNAVISKAGERLIESAGSISNVANKAGTAFAYISALSDASKGKWGSAIGTGVGAYFGGPIGASIGSTIGKMVDDLASYKVEAIGNAIIANVSGKGASAVATRSDFKQTGGLFGGGVTNNSDWSAASAEVTAYVDTQVKLVTESAKAYGTALGLPVSDLDSFKQQIEVSLTGLNADQAKEAINKAIGGFGDALVSANFGPALDGLKRSGETSSATLVRVATEITTVNSAMGMLGGKLFDVNAAGIKAADGLVQAMGGLDAFKQQTASYYDNYYTDEEKRLNKAKDIQSQLANAGIEVSLQQVLDGTKEQFRALVESFTTSGVDLGEAGQKAVAALMGVAGAFAQIATSKPEVKKPEVSVVEQLGTSGPSQSGWAGPSGPDQSAIASEKKSLQDQLDQLTMTSIELLKKQRDAINESNKALFDQVHAAQVAKQNAELQDRIDVLKGTKTEQQIALAKELAAATDESTKALINMIFGLEQAKKAEAATQDYKLQVLQLQGAAGAAELAALQRTIDTKAKLEAGWTQTQIESLYALQTASEEAAKAAEAAAKAQELLSKKLDLQSTLYSLTGDKTAAKAVLEAQRAIQLAALDPSLRELQKQIWGLQDAASASAAALSAAKEAASEAMNALERAVGAQKKIYQVQADSAREAVAEIKTVFDALHSNVRELYGQVDSTAAMQAAQGLDFIHTSLKTAQTTGYLPDSKALAEAIAAANGGTPQWASQFDKDFAKLSLAGDLSQMESIAGNQLTEAERNLRLAEDQLKDLDQILETAKEQLAAAQGTNNGILSVSQAIANLSTATNALAAATAAAAAASKPSTGGSGTNWPVTGGPVTLNSGDSAILNAAKVLYLSATSGISNSIYAAAEAAVGGNIFSALAYDGNPDHLRAKYGFAVGTNYVPYDMTAKIHEGEMIVPKAYNPAAGGQSGNARLETLVSELLQKVARLEGAVVEGNKSNSRIADAVNGSPEMPMLVTTV